MDEKSAKKKNVRTLHKFKKRNGAVRDRIATQRLVKFNERVIIVILIISPVRNHQNVSKKKNETVCES